MGTIDSLPPDQRAVLQLVLRRGRSYDEIAGLLSIDRAAVRRRALDAVDALAPAERRPPAHERGLISDYLLGQLPAPDVARTLLSRSPDGNAWAVAVSRELAALHGEPQAVPPLQAGETTDAVRGPQTTNSAGTDLHMPGDSSRPAGSRRSGAVLLAGVGAIVVVLIVLLITGTFSGGNGARQPTAAKAPTGGDQKTTTSAGERVLAQINLAAPGGAKSPAGVVEVIRVGTATGIVLYATGLTPNTHHNAYAVWLSTPGGGSKFIGFERTLVGKDGKMEAVGPLPDNATSYKQLLVTLETQDKPTKPGQVVLSGPFSERAK